MNAKRPALVVLVTAVLGAGGYASYRLGVDRGMKMAGPDTAASIAATGAPQKAGDIDAATGKKVLYWHDPMVPGQKFDKPGKSPFMDMQLVPVYADEAGDDSKTTISSRVQQNLGIRSADVVRGNLGARLTAVATVAYTDPDVRP